MKNIFSKIIGHNYTPLNIIEISAKNLKENYLYLSSLNKNARVVPVLKSNAYGHGISLVAKQVEKYNPPFICVDSLYEAYELLKAGIKTKILIMGYINPDSLKTKSLPFSFAVYNKELIDGLKKYQPNANIHIFVDTGMHREGIAMEKLEAFLRHIRTGTKLNIEGLMSHFAASDQTNSVYTKGQIEKFEEAKITCKRNGIFPKWIHIGNSLAILNSLNYGKKLGNIERTGISLYGIDPSGKNKNLKPVLTLKTHIAQIKKIKKGDPVGYDFTYVAKKDLLMAILPIGYFDGIDKRLSNKGQVYIKDKYCPIIGKVSMNITTIDISSVQDAKVGDEVIIYSNDPNDKNSIENTAKTCSLLSYEMLANLSTTTKRVVV